MSAKAWRRMPAVARLAGMALMLAGSIACGQEIKDGGPYVPTPQKVVDAMLEIAGVKAGDFVMDLGSGDGRIVLTAVSRYRASGVGVDIDGELVERANATAREMGIADRARFIVQDVHAAEIGKASVITLYLLPGMMNALRPRFLRELRPGTRIVSHDFDLGEWKPERTVVVETTEKYELLGSWTSNVYLWIVPAAVQGSWRGAVSGPAGGRLTLDLRQSFQLVDGTLTRDGVAVPIADGRIEGARIHFVAARPGGASEVYEGIVSGERVAGGIRGSGVEWTVDRAR